MPIKPAIDVKLMVYDEMEIGQELSPLELQHDDDWQGRILVALEDFRREKNLANDEISRLLKEKKDAKRRTLRRT